MMPSVAHYIYTMKHKADKRSLSNVMQNFFDITSHRSSSRFANTVIGEILSDQSLDTPEHEFRM